MEVTYSDYTHRLQSLLEVCRNLSANLEPDDLLHSIIEGASELTHSENSSILAFDKETNSLRFIAAPWYQLDQLKSVSVPLDNSVAGQVFSTAEPMALNHATEDTRIFRVVDRELNSTTRSLLAVPMIYRGKTIGVLESINKSADADYSEEDVTILETLAAQAAIAVENQRLLDESRLSYQKVMEVDRMKSDFIAIASHELRTPLGVIIGHASLMEEAANAEDKKELTTIVNAALQLREIIEQFANIERLEIGLSQLRRARVIILPLIQEVRSAFQDMADDKKINLTVETPQKSLAVEGDAGKIMIVLSNLFKNALTFTNPGGQVRVKADQVPGFVKVTVMDNGIGIPAEEQEKIFERFYQVEKHLTRKHGGMGLGLSIAKDLVEMHGGKIWVESIEGKGSRFIFILPQNAAQISAAARVFKS